MSRVAQIAAFVRLAQGGVTPDTLAKAIRQRWPEATPEDLREALLRAAAATPHDPDELAAMDIAASAMLARRAEGPR